MFEKTLTDVVKGIRASKRDTALYISQCIAEIKTEINSSDMFVKANALQKLTFLQMMGYSMSWASFASIEVMSSPRFAHKRIGYLAASQGFTQDTDVILLTTNLLKKELRGAIGGGMHGVYEAGLAVNCISNIVTTELAKDILPELTNLTKHPQPYLRKKAILCLFKEFVKYPQALRLTFDKIQQCLQDPDPSVVSCAVNVITELSDKNPKNYLHLAPAFFQLLTSSSNNWMLIKVVKLLGSLVPEEPRLARKLLDPLATIVRNTQAKSLLFEAVHTITLCLPYCRKNDGSMPANVPEIVILCAQTLRDFVEQTDQNLKYLGLVGFGTLMQSHPRVLSAPDYRPLILACLSDQDITIRSRALDLLSGMTTRKNLMELVGQLLEHVTMASGTYKHDLVAKIIEMCSSDKYALLQDFAWYLDILFRIGHMRGLEPHGELLRAQITDVALRVMPVRPYAVRRSIEILLEREGRVSDDPYGDNGRGKHIMPDILPAIAWIIGEYSDLFNEALGRREDDDDDDYPMLFDSNSTGPYHSIIQAMTNPTQSQRYPTSTQKAFVQASMKVFAAAASTKKVKNQELEACIRSLEQGFSVYVQSTDVEVVERAFTSLELLKSLNLTTDSYGMIPDLTPVDDDDSADGDLLGMDAGKTSTISSVSTKPNVEKSLGSRIREASAVLSYTLKPTPMKPVGAKAQKKKRDSSLNVNIDIQQPLDLSIIQDLIKEEQEYRKSVKLTCESVCFTQQRIPAPETRLTPSLSFPSSTQPLMSMTLPGIDASTSFQKPSQESPSTMATRQRQGDPFYLDGVATSSADEERDTNRFGTIQLVDSDDESEHAKKTKKKEKKAKRSKTKDAFLGSSGEDSRTPFGLPVEVYHSEDDEDDDADNPFFAKNKTSRKKGTSKEFASLAQVDLTTPLREDEVMPERKHREVPIHKPEEKVATSKSKKEKKQKKEKRNKSTKESADAVGDLLDLNDFGSGFAVDANPKMTSGSVSPAPNSNLISSAFDDLLGLSMPAPVGNTNVVTSATLFESVTSATFVNQIEQNPWMKGTLKLSGPSSVPEHWSSLSLKYRTHRSDQGLMLSFSLENRSAVAISNLMLSFKTNQSVAVGTLSPYGTCETSKVGPFFITNVDDSQDIKGTLYSGEGKITVKVVLPVFSNLKPEENLSLEDVVAELSTPGWTSHSAKLELPPNLQITAAKQLLIATLQSAEVRESTTTLSAFTLASRSVSGSKVRILVKIKDATAKFDVKSTSASLAKAIASDVKRLVL